MEFNIELIATIFEVCIIPILGVLTTFFIKWVNAKSKEIQANVDDATLNKYMDMTQTNLNVSELNHSITMKESITKFDLEAAFKALDSIDTPEVEGGVRANRAPLTEIFSRKSKLDLLMEEYYDVNNETELDDAQNKIRLIEFLITAPVFIINVLFRLFANSIYRNHIPLNIHSNNNGVSMKNAIGGLVLVNLIMFVISLLLNQISAISQFTEATQTLFNWM